MENIAGRHDRNCCIRAEQLVGHIIALDQRHLELAYERLTDLIETARQRRTGAMPGSLGCVC